jgi:predicted MPP superfamily phosphohydrolase
MNSKSAPKNTAEKTEPSQKKQHTLLHIGAVLSAITALLVLLNWGTKTRFVTRSYELSDARIHDEIRIAIISDLHGAEYDEQQSDIVAALEQQNPHIVLLLGDIFDQHGVSDHATELVYALSGKFNCYFIPGNHEYKSGGMTEIRNILNRANIPILAGKSTMIEVNSTRVQIFGIDDGRGGKQKQLRQIADAAAERKDDIYSVLAIHVPNGVESYLHYGFDLMLSGHTHGGQMIISGVLNGLYAPGQGLFPKYGGGLYTFDDQTMIISRGLSQRPLWLPRLGNPPELTIVTLKPAEPTP